VRNVGLIALMAALGLPALALRLSGTHLGTVADTATYGLGIVTAAFLLAWAAEAAEVDISQALAVAIVALIAVLPEYAVDMTFAWKAGQDPEFAPYAVANMTGANRLLIGAAWPLIFLLFWWRVRRQVLQLEHGHAIEVLALAVATIYSFSLPLKGSISLVDTAVLAALFAGYVWVISRAPTEEPELIGPARSIGNLPAVQRRGTIGALLVYAAAVIFASAEPFAEGLVHSGVQLGIDEFLLVQWLAPFASEAPEFLFAGILAWRGRAGVAMGALLSSKVNQWTLLIGGLPVAYGISGGTLSGLPLDGRQTEEVLLTAAQSAFAVAILVSLSLSAAEAALLFALFAVTFVIPSQEARLVISALYVALAVAIAVRQRTEVRRLLTLSRAAIASRAAEEHESAAKPVPPRR
jgi:cation:H+ antiporter